MAKTNPKAKIRKKRTDFTPGATTILQKVKKHMRKDFHKFYELDNSPGKTRRKKATQRKK